MRIGHFTRLKGRTSYFRRKLPTRLRDRFARREICVRLGVLDRESAERQGRRLAVAVDDFFLAALDDAMLSDDDLKKVITSTMAIWWDDDQRRDAEFADKWGARPVPPKDDAKLLGEMASGILGRLAKGKNAHQPEYIQGRVEAAGLPPIE